MRVLIVDDDPIMRRLLTRMVERHDHDVTACEDAETAWARFMEDPFPLLILDWVLMGMSGLELCREIRATSEGDASVIVAVTGRTQPEDLEMLLEAGADDYMAKPVKRKLFDIRMRIAEQKVLQVTKRKQAENELKQVNTALSDTNQRLQEVNQKLKENQAQLVHSEKMASLGQLAAGIAHEINNPIGFIRSNLNTLEEYVDAFKHLVGECDELIEAVQQGDDAAQHAKVRALQETKEQEDIDFLLDDVDLLLAESRTGTERVQEIVKGLKSFARVDEAERQEADINEGIRSTLRVIWNELKYKCEVVDNLQPLPPISCHPGQLNQVFMNLLMNAVQAIPEKGTITLESEATEEEVIVRISDTGVGIPSDHLPELFNPFFTTKPVGEGTGLGLSISYGIVQKHNGRIEVESEEGEGTTFIIYLPTNGRQHP